MSPPKISVIIPVFNGERFIAEAIQSVLDQDYDPLEILVIDDGSTDGTKKVVELFNGKITLISQANQGVAAARNAGLQRATGELITFLDSDDIWVNTKLKLQTRILNENPDVDVVFGMLLHTDFLSFDELKLIMPGKEKGVLAISMGSSVIRKCVFDKTGLFDEEMMLGEDIDWFTRMRETGTKVFVHKEIVQFYRSNSYSLTSDKARNQLYMLKAYKKSLDRRRNAGVENMPEIPEMINFEELKMYWKSK